MITTRHGFSSSLAYYILHQNKVAWLILAIFSWKYTLFINLSSHLIGVQIFQVYSSLNKLAKLQATLVRNYHLLTDGGEV